MDTVPNNNIIFITSIKYQRSLQFRDFTKCLFAYKSLALVINIIFLPVHHVYLLSLLLTLREYFI
jgi:hypothetical protein